MNTEIGSEIILLSIIAGVLGSIIAGKWVLARQSKINRFMRDDVVSLLVAHMQKYPDGQIVKSNETFTALMDKIAYEKLFFQFWKPLKLESWWSAEDIEKLKS